MFILAVKKHETDILGLFVWLMELICATREDVRER